MHFAFDDDQLQLRDAVRTFLTKECTPQAVRATHQTPTGMSNERWSALAEMGVVGCTVPERHGGMGLDATWLVLLLEEAGRFALPEPLGLTTAAAAPLLATLDPDSGLLGGIAGGETLVSVRLPGEAYVEHADAADVLLLADGDSLFAVSRDDVRLTRQRALDPGRRLFSVEWDSDDATLVAGEATGALAAAADAARLADAAYLLGAAFRLIELATTYATEREQFGVPIGSFQAVKHHLATALVETEFARPLVYRAAWSIATSQPTSNQDANDALVAMRRAATVAGRASLQVHGAIGYTWEHDLHLWLNRVIVPG